MRPLPLPPRDGVNVFLACATAVADLAERQNYQNNVAHIYQAGADYLAASQTTSWFSLPRMQHSNREAVAAGSLTKGQMMDLYSDYLASSASAARAIYDEIMVAANGKCPFCGGIGQVWTLDHYLPKSRFPLHSVLPANLVPCCRDCNTGKSSAFGTVAAQQPLHPYLDDNKFFDVRWIYGHVERTNPVTIQFYCAPPANWSPVEQERVTRHFDDYKLAYRYRIQAGAELGRVIHTRKNSLCKLSPEDFQAHLIECSTDTGFDLNGWNRTMYAALAFADWFTSADFHKPET